MKNFASRGFSTIHPPVREMRYCSTCFLGCELSSTYSSGEMGKSLGGLIVMGMLELGLNLLFFKASTFNASNRSRLIWSNIDFFINYIRGSNHRTFLKSNDILKQSAKCKTFFRRRSSDFE